MGGEEIFSPDETLAIITFNRSAGYENFTQFEESN